MILILCTNCGLTLRVDGEEQELNHLIGSSSDYWPDKYPCPDCSSLVSAHSLSEVSSAASSNLRVVDVTPQEAFAALNGLGLPSERSCRLEDVIELIQQNPVVKIVGKDVRGSDRCTIDYMVLSDGSKVYLGPASEGVLIYRITRPHSYTEQVGSV